MANGSPTVEMAQRNPTIPMAHPVETPNTPEPVRNRLPRDLSHPTRNRKPMAHRVGPPRAIMAHPTTPDVK
jgi:hypothetical protein